VETTEVPETVGLIRAKNRFRSFLPWVLLVVVVALAVGRETLVWWRAREALAVAFAMPSKMEDCLVDGQYWSPDGLFHVYYGRRPYEKKEFVAVSKGQTVVMVESGADPQKVSLVTLNIYGKGVLGVVTRQDGVFPGGLWLEPLSGSNVGYMLMDPTAEGEWINKMGHDGTFNRESATKWVPTKSDTGGS
jgi:hypothetical protein